MEKRIGTVLAVLIVISLVSLTGGVRFFLAEREFFAKYMKVKETLEQARVRWEEELARAEEEKEKLRSRLDEVAHQRSELEAENRALTKAKDNLATQVVDLEKKIEAMESELYLVDLLKERAALEVETKNLKERLKSREVELEKIVRTNDELKSELVRLKTESQVAEVLSRDLAKAKKDKYIAIEALGRLEAENRELQDRFAQLAAAKASLEERLVIAGERLLKTEDERDGFAEQLVSARLALKEKADELDKVKARLAKAIEEGKGVAEGKAASIELPPIVVKAGLTSTGKETSISTQGRIVTVNNEYEFVVIDLGREDGVKVGMPFIVYRGDEEIGQVEIIEAHQRISAADIKKVKERMRIEVDDVVVPHR